MSLKRFRFTDSNSGVHLSPHQSQFFSLTFAAFNTAKTLYLHSQRHFSFPSSHSLSQDLQPGTRKRSWLHSSPVFSY
ncbi:Kelch repeat-containing protein [Fusarium oxysporum f. sp. albedinis]|nr:Kelch repeat-containing protein [Fusarium oxysporum f. sp. albedinis]